MSINLVLPQIHSNSLKDNIISLLIENTNLTAKEIHLRISKERTISYQAVFKTLKELANYNVLEKNGPNYNINKNWIMVLKKFTENFFENENKKLFDPSKDTQTLELNTLFEFFGGMLDLFSSDILYTSTNCKHRFGGGYMRHLWWALSFDDQGYKKFKHMVGPKDSYIVVMKNTPVDKWLKSYFEKAGTTAIKLGENYKQEDDLAVVGDYVIQVFFDEKTKQTLDKLYSEVKDISDAIEKGVLDEILMKPTKVKVIITKNKELANIHLKKVLSYFGDPDGIMANAEHTPESVKEIEQNQNKF